MSKLELYESDGRHDIPQRKLGMFLLDKLMHLVEFQRESNFLRRFYFYHWHFFHAIVLVKSKYEGGGYGFYYVYRVCTLYV